MIADTDFQAALRELTATVNSPTLAASLDRCLELMTQTGRPALEAESDWRMNVDACMEATTPKSGHNLAHFEQALKSNGFISDADGVAPRGDYLRDWLRQLQRIEVKPWRRIFQEETGEVFHAATVSLAGTIPRGPGSAGDNRALSGQY